MTKISFTQTYGDSRRQLLEIKFKDKQLLEFLSFFDYNIFSFHNCSEDIIKFFQSNNNIPNARIIINNGTTYTDCIKRLKYIISSLDAKYIFFNQDDTFSVSDNFRKYSSLCEYIFSQNDIMLNLSETSESIKGSILETSLDDIQIYQSDTNTFTRNNKWSFDDSPYVCTTNYINQIYDDNYLSYNDIWSAEHYLNAKFKTFNIKRYVTSKSLFRNYNFLGVNTHNKEEEIKILTSRNLL